MKNLVFASALPGISTGILSNILVTNRDLHVNVSGKLAPAVVDTIKHLRSSGRTVCMHAITGLASGYYSGVEPDVVVDIHPDWLKVAQLLAESTGVKPKLIYLVDSIPAILAGAVDEQKNVVDLQIALQRQTPNNSLRCSMFFDRTLKPAITDLQTVITGGLVELLIIDKNNLANNSVHTIDLISKFIGLDLESGGSGLVSSIDPLTVLGKELVDKWSDPSLQVWSGSRLTTGGGFVLPDLYNTPTLPGDSLDYDLLYRAATTASDVPGIFCEIGVRRGGSLKWIIDAAAANSPGRTILGIDPYGNIEYNATQDFRGRLDYTNTMKNESIPELYRYVVGKPVNLVILNMEDIEFFNRFGDGLPVYDHVKRIEDRYALVFFDGPHDLASINAELDFFSTRTAPGAIYVFDDVGSYPHFNIHTRLLYSGFKLLEVGAAGRKISYQLG